MTAPGRHRVRNQHHEPITRMLTVLLVLMRAAWVAVSDSVRHHPRSVVRLGVVSAAANVLFLSGLFWMWL